MTVLRGQEVSSRNGESRNRSLPDCCHSGRMPLDRISRPLGKKLGWFSLLLEFTSTNSEVRI
jgi:hypothetical protein